MRRRTIPGHFPWRLHCCCVCGQLASWTGKWEWFGSYQELDDSVPVQKFCSEKCKKHQKAVTVEMCEEAFAAEYQP